MKKVILILTLAYSLIHCNAFDQIKKLLNYPDIADILKINELNQSTASKILYFLKEKESKSVQSWSQWYHALAELINDNNLKKGVEVGVAFGTNSIYLLENTSVSKLISVDPYKSFLTAEYNDGMNFEQQKHDVLFQIVEYRLSAFGERSQLIRSTSIEAAQKFENEELDFVYIDGNHSYESVKQDLETWWAKIRPGGLLTGDDYNHPNHRGVTRAVDEFLKSKGLQINRKKGIPHLYWVIKPHVLSFIIPVYNRAKDVGNAIDSIYKQNMNIPFEVICTDDGSTDDSVTILEKYCQKYDNFLYYKHTSNQGASAARNTCIKHARGDLIFNLDSDNTLVPNTVQSLVDLIDQTNCDMAAFEEMRYFDEHGKRRNSILFKTSNHIFDINNMLTMQVNPVASGNYLFTKKSHTIAGGYDGNILETWVFGWRQLSKGFKLAIAPGLHYNHNIKPDSKWCKMQKLNLNDPKVLRTLQSTPELFNDRSNQFLQNYNVKKQNILSDLTNGTIELLPQEALIHIFTAYKLEQCGNIRGAIAKYLTLKKMGYSTESIHRKLMHLRKLDS